MNSSSTSRCSDLENTGADVSASSCNYTYNDRIVKDMWNIDIGKTQLASKGTNNVEEILLFTSADLPDDLRLITEIPDMCDIKFVIGQSGEVVYGIKAVVAMRCRYFYDLIMSEEQKSRDMKKKLKKTRSLYSRLGLFRKRRSSKPSDRHLVIEVEGADTRTFSALIRYLHTGKIKLSGRNVISVYVAAVKFGVTELRTVCEGLINNLITMNSVLSLLNTLENYQDHKSLEVIMEKVLTFIEKNAQNLLRSAQFEHLPKFSADKILTRVDLLVSEEIRWDATLRWGRQHCKGKSLSVFKETVQPYLPMINFGEIPLRKLTLQVQPLGILPNNVIKLAIALHTDTRDSSIGCHNAEANGTDDVVVLPDAITECFSSDSRDAFNSHCYQNMDLKNDDVDITEESFSEESFFFNENDFLDELLEEESRLSLLFDVSDSISEISE